QNCHYLTYSQGGWGANCSGGNAGCLRDQYWNTVFPSGLVVGGQYTITLTSAAATNTYLPAMGMRGVLTQNYNNPGSTSSGQCGGQLVALSISVAFSNANIP